MIYIILKVIHFLCGNVVEADGIITHGSSTMLSTIFVVGQVPIRVPSFQMCFWVKTVESRSTHGVPRITCFYFKAFHTFSHFYILCTVIRCTELCSSASE